MRACQLLLSAVHCCCYAPHFEHSDASARLLMRRSEVTIVHEHGERMLGRDTRSYVDSHVTSAL